MAEYIKREKAFKLIKEQKEKETGAYSKGRNKGLIIAGSIINNKEVLPTADVVEVKCRCADCKHYQRYGRTSLVFEGKNVQAGWCMLRAKTDEEHRMLPFDFCSYGERKENDG